MKQLWTVPVIYLEIAQLFIYLIQNVNVYIHGCAAKTNIMIKNFSLFSYLPYN